ncbi:hypothetical protein [Priestia koreensis]|uniref:hypothetical protein n=1 Tax=Priestia koreensis TaxID=284581 RepID=UPI003457881B
MNTQSFITIFIIYVTLDVLKGVHLTNSWIINHLVEFAACMLVFYIFSSVWHFFTKKQPHKNG